MILRRFGDWFISRSPAVQRAVDSVGWVYACTTKLAETSGLIRFAYFDKETGEAVDVQPDPLSVVQDYVTGEYLGHGDFISRIVSNIGYFGRCAMFIEKVNKDDYDRPSLVRLVPGHMIRYDSNEKVWTVANEPVDARKLIIWRNYHPTYAEVGVPPYFFAKLSLEELYYIHRWNKNFFRSGMRPDVIIRVPQRLTAKQRKEMRDELLEEFAGVDKGNSFFIISGIRDGEVQLSGRSEKDIDFKEGKEFTREEICSVYGVPPALVGIFRYANYANSSAQMHIFWYTSVLPKVHRIIGTLQRRYFDRYWPKLEVRADTAQASFMLIGVDEMSNAVGRLVQAGYTYDEVARILNYPVLAVGRSFSVAGPSASPESGGSGTGPSDGGGESEPEPEPEPSAEPEPEVRAHKSAPFLVMVPSGAEGLLEVVHSKGYERDYAEFYQMLLADRSRAIGRAVRSWTREVIEDVLDSIRRRGFPEANPFIWEHALEEVLGPIIDQHYKDAVARVFDELDEDRPKKALDRSDFRVKRPQLTSYLSPDQLAVIDQDIQALIGKIKGLSVPVIEKTTAIARQAVADGLTVGEIRNLLLDKVGLADMNRATTWARDISGTIYNRGRFAGFSARGVTHHRWVNSRDAFVRDSHVREAGSAPVMLGQPFPVTMCRYPHDPNGPAKETVNCRCTTVAVYVRRREASPQDAPVQARLKPVSEEDEIIKIRERVLTRLKTYFEDSEDALSQLGDLSDLSPNELKVLDDITERHEAFSKGALGAVPIRLRCVGKDLGEKFVDAVTKPSRAKAEVQKGLRRLLQGEDLSNFDEGDVLEAFPEMSRWVSATKYGNAVNGRAIEYMDELVQRAPDLIRKKGIVFLSAASGAETVFTSKMVNFYAGFIQELREFRAVAKDVAKVLDDFQTSLLKKTRDLRRRSPFIDMIRGHVNSLPDGWDKEYFAAVRFTNPSRLRGLATTESVPSGEMLEKSVKQLNEALEKGVKVVLDQGYSSAGPLSMSWSGSVEVYYLVPKKDLAKWWEKNGAFYKLGSYSSARELGNVRKGIQVIHQSEEEIAFKGRYRLREAKMHPSGTRMVLVVEAELD